MPPPSSGGIHIVQILNILEGFPIGWLGHNSAETIHLMAEAMKLAYADRSEYLGDSDFVDVPVTGLTAERLRRRRSAQRSTATARRRRRRSSPAIPRPTRATRRRTSPSSTRTATPSPTPTRSTSPTAAGMVAEGTGILLNNEMDDFSAKPGVPNAYGLIGGDANAVEPGKRPLSSMSPDHRPQGRRGRSSSPAAPAAAASSPPCCR